MATQEIGGFLHQASGGLNTKPRRNPKEDAKTSHKWLVFFELISKGKIYDTI